MERQYLIFIIVAGAAFTALIGLAYFNPFQSTAGEDDDNPNSDTIKVKKGQTATVRYSSAVVKMIQDLPNKNDVEIKVSSELQVVNFAGLNGQVTYPDMTIKWVQDGEEESISKDKFKTIEYRFFPDKGNTTSYVYENVDYIAKTTDAQVIVSVKPLSTAKVGEQYVVKLIMHTGGTVGYAIDDKIIEIVP